MEYASRVEEVTMKKQEALRKLREATSDHFDPAKHHAASTEAVRYWIGKCRELGYSIEEIDAVLHDEIAKHSVAK